MSAVAFNWARQQQGLGSNEALVLRELAYWHKPGKAPYPSQERLARECNGMSLSTLRRALKNLKAIGLLSSIRKWSDKRQHCAYFLHLDRKLVRPAGTSWKEFRIEANENLVRSQKLPHESKAEFVERIKRERSKVHQGADDAAARSQQGRDRQ